MVMEGTKKDGRPLVAGEALAYDGYHRITKVLTLVRSNYDQTQKNAEALALESWKTMNCPWCGSPNIRNSRLRLADLPLLCVLLYPVRCRSCEERYFIGVFAALKLRAAEKVRRTERRRREST